MNIFRRLLLLFIFVPVIAGITGNSLFCSKKPSKGLYEKEGFRKDVDRFIVGVNPYDKSIEVFNRALQGMVDGLLRRVDTEKMGDNIFTVIKEIGFSMHTWDDVRTRVDTVEGLEDLVLELKDDIDNLKSMVSLTIVEIQKVIQPLVRALGQGANGNAERQVALRFLEDASTRKIVNAIASTSVTYVDDFLHNFNTFIKIVRTGEEHEMREIKVEKADLSAQWWEEKPADKLERVYREEKEEEAEETGDYKITVDAVVDILEAFKTTVNNMVLIKKDVAKKNFDTIIAPMRKAISEENITKSFGLWSPAGSKLFLGKFLGDKDFGHDKLKEYMEEVGISPNKLVVLWLQKIGFYLNHFMEHIRKTGKIEKIKLFNIIRILNSKFWIDFQGKKRIAWGSYNNSFVDNLRLLFNKKSKGYMGDLIAKSSGELLEAIGELYDKYRSFGTRSFSHWQKYWLENRKKRRK